MAQLDRPTRGRTSPGRLRALDLYLLHREEELFTRREGPWATAVFVDVGFGETPWTTLEAAQAFRVLNPELQTIGVELEPARVSAAAAFEDSSTVFREGGFEAISQLSVPTRLVRAMNVLRTYPAASIRSAQALLGAGLLEGGLLVEGSCDADGAVLCAHLLRAGPSGVTREGLLLHTDFSRGFAPLLFRDWLPRDLRRRVQPPEPIHAFFAEWTACWTAARAAASSGPSLLFGESAQALAQRIPGVSVDPWLLERGYLLWRPPGGVPG
jgi:hypothetical protein